MKKAYSCNEWSPLKEVIVGTLNNWQFKDSYYNKISTEIEEGLNIFADILRSMNVTVHRPDDYCYNVRDNAIILKDTILECPMMYEKRYIDFPSLKRIFINKHLLGNKYISAPKPIYLDNIMEPKFDAANICRMNDTLIYAINDTGNREGTKWLQNNFPEYNIIQISLFAYVSHIDTSIVPLNEDTILLNHKRVVEDKLPDFIRNKNIIWIEEDDMQNVDAYIGAGPVASNFIGMNVLSYDEKTVFVQDNQPKFIDKLTKHGFECIPVPLKYTREMCGGLHCCTLDLLRTS
jgi:N-dimethylarginine dimethylaminohydrolase